jgi:hypothetical protein
MLCLLTRADKQCRVAPATAQHLNPATGNDTDFRLWGGDEFASSVALHRHTDVTIMAQTLYIFMKFIIDHHGFTQQDGIAVTLL